MFPHPVSDAALARQSAGATPGVQGRPPAALGVPATRLEWGFILLLLAALFALRMAAAHELFRLGVFDQYDVLFDSDPNQYVPALRDGWGFGRQIHPGYGLLFNLPIRALAAALSMLGLDLPQVALREHLALATVPLAATLSGLFWWLAARAAGFSVVARCAGVFLLQVSFSQAVFGVIPESHSISGMLYSVLLWFVTKAARDPGSLARRRTAAAWLALACLMSAVTITNGFVCIAVWLAVRYRTVDLGSLLRQAVLAGAILVAVLGTMFVLTQKLYPVKATHVDRPVATWVKIFINTSPSTVLAIPAVFVNSVFAGDVSRAPLVQPGMTGVPERFPFQFSLQPWTQQAWMSALGWIAAAGLAHAFLRRRPPAQLARAALVVFVFNVSLHAVFGAETFLYSQHWIAFLVFTGMWLLREHKARNTALALGACALALACSWSASSFILATLHAA